MVLRDNISGITRGAIKRAAYKAGVKRASNLIYEPARAILKEHLEKLLADTCKFTELRRSKTVTVMDVLLGCKSNGMTLYGFEEQPLSPLSYKKVSIKMKTVVEIESNASSDFDEDAPLDPWPAKYAIPRRPKAMAVMKPVSACPWQTEPGGDTGEAGGSSSLGPSHHDWSTDDSSDDDEEIPFNVWGRDRRSSSSSVESPSVVKEGTPSPVGRSSAVFRSGSSVSF